MSGVYGRYDAEAEAKGCQLLALPVCLVAIMTTSCESRNGHCFGQRFVKRIVLLVQYLMVESRLSYLYMCNGVAANVRVHCFEGIWCCGYTEQTERVDERKSRQSHLWLSHVHVHKASIFARAAYLSLSLSHSSLARQVGDAFVGGNQAAALLRWRARTLLRRTLRERLDRGAAWATQTGARMGWKAWRDWVSERHACGLVVERTLAVACQRPVTSLAVPVVDNSGVPGCSVRTQLR